MRLSDRELFFRTAREGRVAVRIRDNASSDGTIESLMKFASENGDIDWEIDRDDPDIGSDRDACDPGQVETMDRLDDAILPMHSP